MSSDEATTVVAWCAQTLRAFARWSVVTIPVVSVGTVVVNPGKGDTISLTNIATGVALGMLAAIPLGLPGSHEAEVVRKYGYPRFMLWFAMAILWFLLALGLLWMAAAVIHLGMAE